MSYKHGTITSITRTDSQAKMTNDQISEKEIKVLLLEDNKVNQILAIEMLRLLGIHQVHIAENGLEGLEKVAVNTYDLIVTDIKMPLMDGIEFTINVRKMDKYKTVPIIALTANVREDQMESYYKVGMNNCLMKPVDVVDFEKVLTPYL